MASVHRDRDKTKGDPNKIDRHKEKGQQNSRDRIGDDPNRATSDNPKKGTMDKGNGRNKDNETGGKSNGK